MEVPAVLGIWIKRRVFPFFENKGIFFIRQFRRLQIKQAQTLYKIIAETPGISIIKAKVLVEQIQAEYNTLIE